MFKKRRQETAKKDAKARENVEAMRETKRRSEGGGRMDPGLANSLNQISQKHGGGRPFL
jgi:hypothetical protein